MLFRTVVLKNSEMFQENTGGRGLQIFRKFSLRNINRIRKYINSMEGSYCLKTCLPPMRLTYSQIYSYENKYNLIGGNASNNIKKIILQFFVRLFGYSHENNIKMFWYYSRNILIRLMRWKKNRWNICYRWRQFHWKWMKKQSSIIFKFDNMGKKCDCRNMKNLMYMLF